MCLAKSISLRKISDIKMPSIDSALPRAQCTSQDQPIRITLLIDEGDLCTGSNEILARLANEVIGSSPKSIPRKPTRVNCASLSSIVGTEHDRCE